METLCRLRDVFRAISAFEAELEQRHQLCLNEGILLCTLSQNEPLSSGEIAQALDLTPSNASKIICSVERKGFVQRGLGISDKRQMYFSLTAAGRRKLSRMRTNKIELPELLDSIIEK